MNRQEKAYAAFVDDAHAAAKKEHGADLAKEVKYLLSDEHVIMAQVVRTAFYNALWREDDRAEAEETTGLKMLLKIIPEIADPANENTQKIISYLEQEIAESEKPMETISDAELVEITGGEEDNTPIPL